MATAKTYTPRDPGPLSRTVVIWVWIDLAITVLAVVSNLISASQLSRADGAGVYDIDSAPILEMVVGLAQFVVFLVSGFLSLKWIYRVSRNAHALAHDMTVSPPWAIGWYFVPLANLLMPFRALREIWQVSTQPLAWRSVETPGLLRWWWGLWLVTSFLGNVSFRLTLRANTNAEVLYADIVDAVLCALSVPLDLVFIAIVRQLTARQKDALEGGVFD